MGHHLQQMANQLEPPRGLRRWGNRECAIQIKVAWGPSVFPGMRRGCIALDKHVAREPRKLTRRVWPHPHAGPPWKPRPCRVTAAPCLPLLRTSIHDKYIIYSSRQPDKSAPSAFVSLSFRYRTNMRYCFVEKPHLCRSIRRIKKCTGVSSTFKTERLIVFHGHIGQKSRYAGNNHHILRKPHVFVSIGPSFRHGVHTI